MPLPLVTLGGLALRGLFMAGKAAYRGYAKPAGGALARGFQATNKALDKGSKAIAEKALGTSRTVVPEKTVIKGRQYNYVNQKTGEGVNTKTAERFASVQKAKRDRLARTIKGGAIDTAVATGAVAGYNAATSEASVPKKDSALVDKVTNITKDGVAGKVTQPDTPKAEIKAKPESVKRIQASSASSSSSSAPKASPSVEVKNQNNVSSVQSTGNMDNPEPPADPQFDAEIKNFNDFKASGGNPADMAQFSAWKELMKRNRVPQN